MTATIPETPWVPDVDFGARLILVRHSLGLTLREAAAMCGISYRTWGSWETEGRRPQDVLEVVQQIANGLGVDRHWLAWGEATPDALRISLEHNTAGQDRFSGSDIKELCAAAEDLERSFSAA